MNIAMIHYRVGETDGVSLEMDKWRKILEKNGHTVYYIAGSEGTSKAHVISELYYRDEYDAMINNELFKKQVKFTDEELKERVMELSQRIERQFVKILTKYDIDLVIPNNVLSLGRSPHVAMALTNAILKTDVKVIGHHHDFYWEREKYSHPQSGFAAMLLDTYFPPKALKAMQHVVINKLAKHDLLKRKGMESTVVPNVLDFDQASWVEDSYNQTYKEDMDIDDNEIIFLQATRVTNRKAIELAVDLMAILNEPAYREKLIGKTLYDDKTFTEDTQLVMAMVGMHEGGDGYEDKLIKHAEEKGVRVIVKPKLVDHARHEVDGQKVYSLFDVYVHCDIITYPSIYEGWGNQFIEGIFAKKPQIVFEYSVFESDIKDYGFDYISLGNSYDTMENGLACVTREVLENAADETIAMLTDSFRYQTCVEKNYAIAKQELSLDTLERLVQEILGEVQ